MGPCSSAGGGGGGVVWGWGIFTIKFHRRGGRVCLPGGLSPYLFTYLGLEVECMKYIDYSCRQKH